MNKIPKEKRDKIMLIGVGALGVVIAYWYLVVSAQNETLGKYHESISLVEDQIGKAQSRMRGAALVQTELRQLREKIAAFESHMIPTEQLSGKKWIYDTIYGFVKKKRYDVTPTSISNEPKIGHDFLMLPNFYYEGAYWTVTVRGYYHEFGKFLADFENNFPLISVQNVTLVPLAGVAGTAPGANPGAAAAETAESALSMADREKLAITMRIAVLFKPVGAL